MIPGVSGNDTEIKQADFRDILAHHLDVCQLIFNGFQDRSIYRYIDIFGGPGCPDGIMGSPVIFQELVQKTAMTYDADVFELNPESHSSLKGYLKPPIRVHLGDASRLVKLLQIGKSQYGLLYCDPPQTPESFLQSIEIMKYAAQRYRKLDLMLYISGRLYKAHKTFKDLPYITEVMSAIDKQHWAIRKLRTGQQWTFLIGTNYIKWADWRKRGLYPIDSPEGLHCLEHLNLTRDEIKKKVQPYLTGLMQSTSSIPDLELSEHKPSKELMERVKDAIKGRLRKFIT